MKGRPLPDWVWVFPVIGAFQLAAFTLLGGWDQTAPGTVIGLLLTVAFAGGGGLLIVKGRPQPAPVRLGGAFLLVASAFGPDRALTATGALPMLGLAAVEPAYLIPSFLWSFAAVFPQASPLRSPDAFAHRMTIASIAAGTSLFAIGLALHVAPQLASAPGLGFLALTRTAWFVVYILCATALLHIAARARRVRRDERRRVTLFAAGILLGSAPSLVVSLILLLSPSLLARVQSNPQSLSALRLISYAGLIAVPIITMYAVLQSRVLGLREVARSSIRTILARQVAYAALAVPVLVLGVLLVGGDRFGAAPPREIVGIAVAVFGVGLLGLLQRRRILALVDRYFFPEHERIDQALDDLHSEIEVAPSLTEIAGSVRIGLEQAMELSRACLMRLDPARGELRAVRGETRPLPLSKESLAELASHRLLDLASRSQRAIDPVSAWVDETGIELLVALPDGPGMGVIGTGIKRSGMPFVRQDERRLLRIADATGATLRRLHTGGVSDLPPAAPVTGFDCASCGTVSAASTGICRSCGSPVVRSALPMVIAGKFRLVRRLGAGAFGVVYEAEDLDLHRSVAVKALNTHKGQDPTALLAEARFMASLSHPALATIHGTELADGVPVLVLQYFENGSLADRLKNGAIPWTEAVDMGIQLADALAYLHARQMLHGDVKPSNVGIASPDSCKLIDFGLARFVSDTTPIPEGTQPHAVEPATGVFGGRPGTAAYLPPEANERTSFDVQDDVWALAVTIYQAIAGRHPLSPSGGRIPIASMLIGAASPLDPPAPDCPDTIARLLDDALATDPARRPRSASDFAGLLRSARATSFAGLWNGAD